MLSLKKLSARLRGKEAAAVSPRILDLIPLYENAQHSMDRSEYGVKQYCREIRAFARWLNSGGNDATLDQFTREAVLNYRDQAGAKRQAGSTIINKLASLRSFGEWLIERGYIEKNPTVNISRPRKRGPDPHPLTVEQVDKLLKAIEPPQYQTKQKAFIWYRNRRIVYLALFAGLRREEIRQLRWGHCIFNTRLPFIDLQDGTKYDKERRVIMHSLLIEELLRVPAMYRQADFFVCGTPTGDPLSRGGVEHVFDRWLAQELRIDEVLETHLHPHKLRATFATEFIESGGDLLSLRDLMGHANVATLQRYVKIGSEKKKRHLEDMRFGRK